MQETFTFYCRCTANLYYGGKINPFGHVEMKMCERFLKFNGFFKLHNLTDFCEIFENYFKKIDICIKLIFKKISRSRNKNPQILSHLYVTFILYQQVNKKAYI